MSGVFARNRLCILAGAGMGGGADELFGSRARGMDALLSKVTIVLSIVFAILTLVLGRLMNTY